MPEFVLQTFLMIPHPEKISIFDTCSIQEANNEIRPGPGSLTNGNPVVKGKPPLA